MRDGGKGFEVRVGAWISWSYASQKSYDWPNAASRMEGLLQQQK
jgi:hypothetical protein